MASRNRPKQAGRESAQQDQSVVEIVEVINGLLLKARFNNLVTVSSILEDARESIAWWAVHEDCTEAEGQMLAHHLNYSSALYTALTFMAKFSSIKDEQIRQELLETIAHFTGRTASAQDSPPAPHSRRPEVS